MSTSWRSAQHRAGTTTTTIGLFPSVMFKLNYYMCPLFSIVYSHALVLLCAFKNYGASHETACKAVHLTKASQTHGEEAIKNSEGRQAKLEVRKDKNYEDNNMEIPKLIHDLLLPERM